jgi:hypothetical protein
MLFLRRVDQSNISGNANISLIDLPTLGDRKMIKKTCLLGIVVFALVGCAATLTPDGEKVRVVSESQKERSCKFIKLISVKADLGPDKPGSALRLALNATAAVGGNGFFIITNTVHWIDGASVSGEALNCVL